MRFPHRFISIFTDATRNFEYLEGSGLTWGQGAPSKPPADPVAYYFRLDKSLAANTRIYYWNGSSWTGIA